MTAALRVVKERPMETTRTVYVVDDSLSVRKAIEHMLTPQGMEVVAVESGAQALIDLEEQSPDLVLCDLVLPDIDGFEVCRHIRKHPTLHATPVLFISGIVDDETRRQSEDAGADGVLKKPFSSHVLLQRIEELMEEAARKAAAAESAEPEAAAPSEELPEVPSSAHEALERLERMRDFRFALVADSARGVLLRGGLEAPPAGSDLEHDLLELVESAADVAARLHQGDLGTFILESEHGLLLLQSAGPERSLVVCLTGDPLLGQGRYSVRRTARELASILPPG